MKKGAIIKIVFAVAIVLLIAPLAGYLYLRSYLPRYDATLKVAGLAAPVTIKRNQYAVPFIEAQNTDDLYFAWGYVNAQDRMFQMEVVKRIGQGRIAEFAGEEALPKDIFLRAVGFHEAAKREAATLPPADRQVLQRFVDGINYYQLNHRRPLYFRLLGLKKELWTIADPMIISQMLNWQLAYNLGHELLYHKIAAKIGADRSRRLLKLIPPETPTIVSRTAVLDQPFLDELTAFGTLLGGRSASNNWVLAPPRTKGTGALLANDPHVHGSKIPDDFYLVRVKAGDFEAAGGQVAGLPFIAFGYNRHIAWGITNQGADVVDVFVEKVDWEKKTYSEHGRELPLIAKKAEFTVKGSKPQKKTLYYAGRRPLLNAVFPEIQPDISLDWAGYDSKGHLGGFLALNRAGNHSEFIAAVNQIHMTPQNMVYADRSGNIAYRTIGTLPKRTAGSGNFFQDADTVAANWQGLLDPNLNPAAYNPAAKVIVTANNRVIRDYPYEMNGSFAPRFRYERIADMLAKRDVINVAYCKKMQNDTRSALARQMIPVMRELIAVTDTPLARKAYQLVAGWDGDIRADRPEAAIYNTWLQRFMYQTFRDELGADLAAAYVGERYISLERFLDLLKNQSDFFDDATTPQKESVRDIASRAFEETLSILSTASGSEDIGDWQWGRFHRIRFDHLLGKSRLLRPFVNRGPYPIAGDCETNMRAHFKEIQPPYTAAVAAALRLVVEFDPEPRGHMVLIAGQNEYFLSAHYDDMTSLWRQGKYFVMEESKTRYQTIMRPG